MIIPTRLEYYGDRAKAEALKGKALQLCYSWADGIGQSLIINRTKKLDDTAIIQAIITRNPYGNLFGVVRINVATSGSETSAILFCTSFNAGVDDGTQVYKKPYPPITQGDLVTLNPQTIPYPEYSARSNFRNNGYVQSYWVDTKETNCISWSYEFYYDSGNRKGGRLSIQGLENAVGTLVYIEPLFCALIPYDENNPEIQRLVMIYRDRLNYSGTGTTRYCAVYDYVLDFDNQVLTLSNVSSFNLTSALFAIESVTISDVINSFTARLYGLMNNTKTLIYAKVETVSYSQGGFSYNGTARVLKYLEFNDDYSAISVFDRIFAETPIYQIYNNEGGYVGDTSEIEDWFQIIDIRDKVRFCTERYTVGSSSSSIYKYSWSKPSELSKSQFASGANFYDFLFTKNDLIYSQDNLIKSNRLGLIAAATNKSHYIEDYAYTNDVLVASFYVVDDVDYSQTWTSVVLDYKNKSKKILSDTDLKTISVTKLPTVTTP